MSEPVSDGLPCDVARGVIEVFDGLRPDPVTSHTIPHLHRSRERALPSPWRELVAHTGRRDYDRSGSDAPPVPPT